MKPPFWCQLRALIELALLDLYRRRDLLVLSILGLLVVCPLLVVSPFGVKGAGRYLDELTLLFLWLASGVVAIGVAARQFPPEFEQRTIYPLLAKPISRSRLLLGKYLGATVASLSALTLFYLAYVLLGGLRQGRWLPEVLLQAYLLHAGVVMVIVAFVILGSLLFTPAANMTLATVILTVMLLFGHRISLFAATQPLPVKWVLVVIDWLAPHVEFFDLRQRVIHAWPALSWRLVAGVLGYGCGHALLSLTLAGQLLRRRQL